MQRDWAFNLLVAVPMSELEIARAIGRALDFDTGGAASFDFLRATDTVGGMHAVCFTSWPTQNVAEITALAADPASLHSYCVADYAARWPSVLPPTLEQCEIFLSTAKLVMDANTVPFSSMLSSLGLTAVEV